MSRKEQIFEKYKEAWKAKHLNGEELLRSNIDLCSQYDPSGNNKYSDWMIKVLFSSDLILNENIVEIVKLFHKHQNGITSEHVKQFINRYSASDVNTNQILAKPRDINVYPTISFLNGVLDFYIKEKTEKKNKKDKAHEYDIILNDNNYMIAVPLTYDASKKLGFGTKWCTAMKEQDGHFKSHTRSGILYYIIDKVRTDPNFPLYKFAYHRAFDKTMGVSFNSMDFNMGDITNLLSYQIIKLIDDYHNKQCDVTIFFDRLISKIQKLRNQSATITSKTASDNKVHIKLPLNYKWSNSEQDNRIIIDNLGFDGWSYLVELAIHKKVINYSLTLLHNNKTYKPQKATAHTLDIAEVVRITRNMIKFPKNTRHSFKVFFDDLKRTLINYKWPDVSIMVYNTIQRNCAKLSDKKWNVKLYSKIEDLTTSGVIKLSIQNKEIKSTSKGCEFIVRIYFETKSALKNQVSIDVSVGETSNAKYKWNDNTIRLKCVFDEMGVINSLRTIINEVKHHIVNGKRTKPKWKPRGTMKDYIAHTQKDRTLPSELMEQISKLYSRLI